MKDSRIESILFDLDGTLTDPKEGIVNSILYALDKLEIKEKHIKELDAFIGPPLRDSFKKRYNLSDELANKAMCLYREYFSEKGLYENVVYAGIEELLEFLYSHKYKLFIATSKPTLFAERILRYFNLDKYFIETIGSNLDNTRTDKTEIISHVVSVHRLQANKSVMIGDRKHDIIGAKNNSMRSIAVTYGYGSLEEISLHKPDFIVNDCDELKSILFK
jgi:phosphoglycolate phosphatase